MPSFAENHHATYHIRNGIMHITYKPSISIDLAAAIQIVGDRLKLQEGLSFPVLCDIRGIHEVNKSARDYLAIEGSTLVTAVAFIVEPTVSKVLSEFYLRISSPPVPSQTFTNIDNARKFLDEYLGT